MHLHLNKLTKKKTVLSKTLDTALCLITFSCYHNSRLKAKI